MYEVTVSAPLQHNYLLNYLFEDISPYISQIGGTFATLHQKHRTYLSLACKDTFRAQTQRLLQERVSQILSLGYKNIFVRQLLDVDNANFYQNVLIDTMCAFDHQYDAQLFASNINCDKDIFLDGYYNFRMGKFKRKWESVVNMILENDYILSDNELILEFLQYLSQSVERSLMQLSVCFTQDQYTLYDSKGKVMQTINTLSANCTAEENAIVNAICLNPQKLKVYHKEAVSHDFTNIAKALFEVQFVQVQ